MEPAAPLPPVQAPPVARLPLMDRLKALFVEYGRLAIVLYVIIQVLVLLHVLALGVYWVLKGQNLVMPMITGKKRLLGATRAPMMMNPILALVVFALSALGVFVFVRVVS